MSRQRKGIVGDDRLQRFEEHSGRESRSMPDAERSHDGTILNEAERRQMLRDEFKQEALPQPPSIPGMHQCWLSTTNSQDPIPRRVRLGYTPVRFEELPGFDTSYKMQSGQFEGCVSCNEMVLFKIPLEGYLTIMNEFHHEMPLEEEEGIRAKLSGSDITDRTGRPVAFAEGDGFNDLVKRKRPSFAMT